MGGICVNWGCILFKVFFVVLGKVWELWNVYYLKILGIELDNVFYDR